MVDEFLKRLETFGQGIEATSHPELHRLLADVAGILRVLYDAVVETGTATHGAIPVVTVHSEPDSRASAPEGEG